MLVLTLICANPHCRERTEDSMELDLDMDSLEAADRTLRYDAKLAGWIRAGRADYCSEACREAVETTPPGLCTRANAAD